MLIRTRAVPAFVIVEQKRLVPRYWATVWSAQLEIRGLAENSRKGNLRHLDAFYRFFDDRYGLDSLDTAISTRDAEALQNGLEAFYAHLTHSRYGHTEVQRWVAVSAFCKAVAKRLATGSDAWRAFGALIDATGGLRPPNRGRPRFIRALPSATLEDFLEIAEPASVRNPFESTEVRWRNWLIVNLLLLCGLRRGEALLLLVDSLKGDVDRHSGQVATWLDVTTCDEEKDLRATRPGIKTAQSHRQIPVSHSLAQLYRHYVSEMRDHDVDHRFLLTSERGSPLSAESITKAFNKLTNALSEGARRSLADRSGGKTTISPHDLRHTCATARYSGFMAQDRDRELAFQRMRAFFGWSQASTMPAHYARAAIQDDLLATWNTLFDSRVNLLRSFKK